LEEGAGRAEFFSEVGISEYYCSEYPVLFDSLIYWNFGAS
jgi:hypothetical protein